jgi:acetolactate synthase-1/2/3 large subunit
MSLACVLGGPRTNWIGTVMTTLSESALAPTGLTPRSRRMLGSDAVLRALELEGVRVCFGLPGGAILPIYDAIARGTSVRHVLATHEQGAGHMAQGYARATGQPGVVLATSGPGATNLVTPIADAAMDSTPLVCITGQVRSHLIGSDAFQECDISGVVTPLVKHSWVVRDIDELPLVLRSAFELARGGRPGPVLVDIPRDVQEAELEFVYPDGAPLPGWAPPATPDRRSVSLAVDALLAARRPVLYVGGGAQGASAPLRALAERAQVPVVTTLMGKGAFPETHQLFFAHPGMHGAKWANWALNRADLILAAGVRFDDRVTGRLDAFAPDAVVVHLDVDPYEIDKIRHADVPVVGDLAASLTMLGAELASRPDRAPATAEWLARIREWRERFPLRYDTTTDVLKPQRVIEFLSDVAPGAVFTTGVGQHQMWAMQYIVRREPRTFITSGGHGTMGFGLPAALGAKAARPGATVFCVDGDGSFHMTLQELRTAVAEDLPVIVVVINNRTLGMVHQWQSMFYGERLSQVDLALGMPDLATIARGFGALGYTVRSMPELQQAVCDAVASGRTAVIDAHVDGDERCYPMIAPGAAAVDMLEWVRG